MPSCGKACEQVSTSSGPCPHKPITFPNWHLPGFRLCQEAHRKLASYWKELWGATMLCESSCTNPSLHCPLAAPCSLTSLLGTRTGTAVSSRQVVRAGDTAPVAFSNRRQRPAGSFGTTWPPHSPPATSSWSVLSRDGLFPSKTCFPLHPHLQ